MMLGMFAAAAGFRGVAPVVEIVPEQQQYSVAATKTTFDIQPTDGRAHLVDNAFSSLAGLVPQQQSGTTTLVPGGVQISGTINQYTQGPVPEAPLQFISIDVNEISTVTSGYNAPVVGWVIDNTNHVLAAWNRDNGLLQLFIKKNDVNTFVGSVNLTTVVGSRSSVRIGIGMNSDSVSVYYDIGAGWVVAVSAYGILSRFNIQSPAVLATMKPCFGVRSTPVSTWSFSRFTVGALGTCGMRDIRPVTHPDGSPVVRGNKLVFSAHTFDVTSNGFLSIWELDLVTYAATQISSFQGTRGGVFERDVAAHVVMNSEDSFDIYAGTWGERARPGGTITSIWYSTSKRILDGGIHNIGTAVPMVLPGMLTSEYGAYDTHIVFDGSRYLCAYTITERHDFSGSPFYSAVAESVDRVTWTLVWSDPTRQRYEGNSALKAGGAWWYLSGGETSMNIHDAAGNYIGKLDGAHDGRPTTQPWPSVVPVGDVYIMLSFDGVVKPPSSRWGNLVVKTAPRFA
ncbi:hypothetical protein H9645_03595 [Luteimonas sp. Sa2BVA3]|uniref:LamG domain-containing protein n=1 Tax=Luteimonas colneyensis TaxID=2762230 RepID=A0ABR8UGZ6_9GAMM|nr:hypothetical protein [Luteimonas colneyensis]MBD7987105.1 hypothetical protein [Luteimonas colneyensis]